jgi:UrcA family protein
MKSITKTSIAGLVALLLCVAEGVMFATNTSAAELQQSTSVRYADLNLDLPADVAKLYHRIADAADGVCGPRELTGSRLVSPGYQRCFADAVAQAIARVDRPALSAYHQQQLGTALRRDATIAQR